MVYSTGQGVHGFTLDPSVGEFLMSHPNIQIPKRGKIYSCNEGNYNYWDPKVRAFLDYLKAGPETDRVPYSSRYVGSLVADFHRTLLYGGFFMYPLDDRDPKAAKGKLRLLYEANPMAFLAEQAGGAATTGAVDVLDVEPQDLHERTPLFIGSEEEVDLLKRFLRGEAPQN